MAKRQPRRLDFKRRTSTTFTKTYGNSVYSFSHEVTEVDGYTSAVTVVRVKEKGASRLTVGKVAHMLLWEVEKEVVDR
ncbi:hypothetical protein [Streptomyces sp. NPDC002758]